MNRGVDARRRGVHRSLAGAAAIFLCLTQPAAAHASVSNRELVEVADIDSLSASPDGRFAVFRTVQADVGRNSYTLRWYLVDLSSGSVRDIGSGGEPIYFDPGSVRPEKAIWPPGGGSVVVRALVDGAVGLWRAELSGGRMVPLVVRDADVEDYSLGAGGRSLLYKVGPSRDEIRRAEQREYDEGILVNSSVDLAQNLFRGGSINGRMSTQRLVGYWYIRDGLTWRAPRQRRRYDLLTGADSAVGLPEPVPPFNFSVPAGLEAATAGGDTARANWDNGAGSLKARMSGGSEVACADPMCGAMRISALVWRPGGRELLVTFIDRELRQSLTLWDPATNVLRRLTAADGLLSGGRRSTFPCAVGRAAALCVAAGPASPPRLERVDLESGDRAILFDPNRDLRANYQPDTRYLSWKVKGGALATGVLLTRKGAPFRNAPLYVNYYHCDGFVRGGTGDEWPVTELLDAGFAVACINVVPLPGAQDGVENYRTGFEAVRALIDRLDAEGIVDSSRVAMGGLSFGSEVALWTAMNSKLLAALSIASGQIEPVRYWLDSMPGSDRAKAVRSVWGLGRPEETPSRWKLVSPAFNAARMQVPILFQLPEQEARMIPELYARLHLAGVPAELYAFPDEAHLKLQPRHRLAVYERNLDWFRYWLQHHRDPDPMKSEQYRRWDLLRERWSRSTASATTEAKAQARPSR
ncbi:MAG: Atxe2 family lasso peptide isopeptidase [Pseudomonadota bacterium]|nr:Atxe2 family lasso peptide isopeptidase [Pseudomonadota bacterium]